MFFRVQGLDLLRVQEGLWGFMCLGISRRRDAFPPGTTWLCCACLNNECPATDPVLVNWGPTLVQSSSGHMYAYRTGNNFYDPPLLRLVRGEAPA